MNVIFLRRLLFLLVIAMSQNRCQNLWKDMLLDLQKHGERWLKQIHQRVDVSNDEFLKMFLRAVNNR